MRVSNTYFTGNFLSQIDSLKQQQNTLQNEATTGLKVSEPEDDPAVMGQVLDLQSEGAANTQYQSNISALQSDATNSYSAMNSLQTIVDRVSQIATLAASGTTSSSQLSSYATEVGQLMQQAVQIANTQDANGNYIFGGTASGSKPFTAQTNSSGAITSVTYNGNSSVAQSDIAPGMTVSAQTPGANTSGSGARGLITDSRYGADLFSHMIQLQSDLTSGNTSNITSNVAPALTNDENNVVSCISANSDMQSALSNAATAATSTGTNITTQISNNTSADMATTLTQLSQTQTAYEAALESGMQVMNFSLINLLA